VKLYGCHNKPREDKPLLVQDGYVETIFQPNGSPRQIVRLPRMVSIPRVNSLDCRYEKRFSDPGCKDCEHAK
jgi:hypothetical protein